ncbi:Os07g0510800 protein, related [Eimeria brunetti]|uniref:Os07g0510800 protein, related n=1 Tax=Eimeria brunetti TaxID=51314 RepID=U6LAB8_9EIME|nr:Os07g0510800 protein, related [Eimeria brunetti]
MPSKGVLYRLNKDELEAQREIIQSLKNAKWITMTSSPFAAPAMIVGKKDDGSGKQQYRMVINYQELNAITISPEYPLPRIQDILDLLHGAKVFNTMDMEQGFHKMRMAPENQHKTAFRTCMGQYEFKVMPFGLKGAPGTFQAIINHMLLLLIGRGVIAYLDDVLVYSEDEDSHAQLLDHVLKTLWERKMYPKFKKCLFDASGYAVGGVLEQDGKPLGFMSMKMSPAEQRYSVYDQELLALIRALEKWRQLLLVATVTAYTDHSALQYITTMKTTTPIRPRVARWLEFVMDFQDLKVEYRPGANNVVANALSRCPYYQPVEAETLRDAANDTTEVGNCFLVQTADDDLQESQGYTKALTPLQEGEKDRQWKIRIGGSWRFNALQQCNEFSAALTTMLNHNQQRVMAQIHGKQHEFKLLASDAQLWKHVCGVLPKMQSSQNILCKAFGASAVPANNRRWAQVSLDFITALPLTDKGHDTTLTLLDTISKAAHFVPTKTTATAADTLELLADRVMEPLLYPVQSEKGLVKLLAPPNRRPNGQGAPDVGAVHTSTGLTPFEVMIGKNPLRASEIELVDELRLVLTNKDSSDDEDLQAAGR